MDSLFLLFPRFLPARQLLKCSSYTVSAHRLDIRCRCEKQGVAESQIRELPDHLPTVAEQAKRPSSHVWTIIASSTAQGASQNHALRATPHIQQRRLNASFSGLISSAPSTSYQPCVCRRTLFGGPRCLEGERYKSTLDSIMRSTFVLPIPNTRKSS